MNSVAPGVLFVVRTLTAHQTAAASTVHELRMSASEVQITRVYSVVIIPRFDVPDVCHSWIIRIHSNHHDVSFGIPAMIGRCCDLVTP